MANTNNSVPYVKCVLYTILLIVAFAIIISGLALGITDIVIGAKFLRSDCHIHDLAKYLIVMGVFSIVNFLIFCTTKCKKNDNDKNDMSACEYLFAFIGISIGIWGMTLVWNSEQNTCPSTLYNYAYYRTVYLYLL
jgi:hypothetical protein